MHTLYLDCFAGISGDMSVAALLDLGLEASTLEQNLQKLGLASEYHIHVSRQSRCNIAGVKFDVHVTAHEHAHEHSHSTQPLHPGHAHPHSHPHPGSHAETRYSFSLSHSQGESSDHAHPHAHGRTFREIREILADSSLSQFVRDRSTAVFHRIAVAEGKIHGMPPEDVTFHEVGAVDSIIDIVGFCIGIEELGIDRVLASRLTEGTGFIDCAHGRFPLPAPATLEILAGIPLTQIDESTEFITPTGAAIVAEFVESFGPIPPFQVDRIGYGLGTRDTHPRPNVLRAFLGTPSVATAASSTVGLESDTISEIHCNLDDCSAEIIGAATERLLAAGALDVFTTPAQMKKNRPGTLLTALCEPALTDALARIILRETSAFGVRIHDCRRQKLRREIRPVPTPHGPILVKFGYLGDDLVQAAPEHDSCLTAAHQSGLPLPEIYRCTAVAVEKAEKLKTEN